MTKPAAIIPLGIPCRLGTEWYNGEKIQETVDKVFEPFWSNIKKPIFWERSDERRQTFLSGQANTAQTLIAWNVDDFRTANSRKYTSLEDAVDSGLTFLNNQLHWKGFWAHLELQHQKCWDAQIATLRRQLVADLKTVWHELDAD